MRTVRGSPASPGRLEGSRSGGHSCPCRRRGRSRPGGRRSLCRCRLQWRRRKARHPRRATNRGCARGRIRTCDLPLRRRLLYPLSYAGRIDAGWDTSRRMLLWAKRRAPVAAPRRSPGRWATISYRWRPSPFLDIDQVPKDRPDDRDRILLGVSSLRRGDDGDPDDVVVALEHGVTPRLARAQAACPPCSLAIRERERLPFPLRAQVLPERRLGVLDDYPHRRLTRRPLDVTPAGSGAAELPSGRITRQTHLVCAGWQRLANQFGVDETADRLSRLEDVELCSRRAVVAAAPGQDRDHHQRRHG